MLIQELYFLPNKYDLFYITIVYFWSKSESVLLFFCTTLHCHVAKLHIMYTGDSDVYHSTYKSSSLSCNSDEEFALCS